MFENAEAQDIHERVLKIYMSLSPGGRPPPASGEGELDSMAFVEFITLVEREFDISIAFRDINDGNFKTAKQTVAFIQEKRASKGRAAST